MHSTVDQLRSVHTLYIMHLHHYTEKTVLHLNSTTNTITLVRFGTPVMTQIRLVLVREPAEEGLFLLIGTADAQSVRYTVGLMAAAHRICNMNMVSSTVVFQINCATSRSTTPANLTAQVHAELQVHSQFHDPHDFPEGGK